MAIHRRVLGCFSDRLPIVAGGFPALHWVFHLGWDHLDGILVSVPLPVLLTTESRDQMVLNGYGIQADRLAIAAAERLEANISIRDFIGKDLATILVGPNEASALANDLPTWSKTSAILQIGHHREISAARILPYHCPQCHRLSADTITSSLDSLDDPPSQSGISFKYNCEDCNQRYSLTLRAPNAL